MEKADGWKIPNLTRTYYFFHSKYNQGKNLILKNIDIRCLKKSSVS